MVKYKSVECTHYDFEQGYWYVDAWVDPEVSDEGKVVAVINDAGGVYYADPDARNCENVVKCVKDKQTEIKSQSVHITPCGEEEVVNVYIDKEKMPTCFNGRVKNLVEWADMTTEEAENWLAHNPICLEVYWSKDRGFFAVESDAVNEVGDSICDPYTGIRLTPADE